MLNSFSVPSRSVSGALFLIPFSSRFSSSGERECERERQRKRSARMSECAFQTHGC
jgi:hypothetical protein